MLRERIENIDKQILYLAFGIACALPIYHTLSQILLIVLLLFLLFKNLIKNKRRDFNFKEFYKAPLLILFLIPILAIPFSEAFYNSTRSIGKSWPFLLLPLVAYLMDLKQKQSFVRGFKNGIIIGALIASVVMLLNNFYYIITTDELIYVKNKVFNYNTTYYKFAEILKKHPTYIGAEVLMALIFVVEDFRKNKIVNKKSLFIGLSFLYSISLVFINSRIILLVAALYLVFILSLSIKNLVFKAAYFKVFALLAGFVLLSGITLYALKDSYILARFTKELNWELTYQKGTHFNEKETSDSRMARWQSAVKVIKENPYKGYGNYSERKYLLAQYEKDGLTYSISQRYDTHNNYLSYLIEYGIWGFALLILFLLQQFYISIRNRDAVFIFYLVLLTILGLTENYLRRGEGVLFTSLFTTYFMMYNLWFKRNHSDDL